MAVPAVTTLEYYVMTHPTKVQPVILCGGSGTRLWPLSRAGFPKQFLCLTGADSLFQQAAKRLMGLGAESMQVADPLVVTGEDHRFLATEQLREIGVSPAAALLEPLARNTAPALTLAALAAVENGDDPVLVVTPADQTVADASTFNGTMHDAIRQAIEGAIVILGVTPDRPETGYGYIQAIVANTPTLVVERFVEKPDAPTAQQYLEEGGYCWNAGMFVLKASVWLQAIESFRPDIAATTRAAWAQRSTDAAFVRPGKAEFVAVPSDSIDYAVMERCPGSRFSIRMVPLDAGWSDLGAWDAVWSVLLKDPHGNAHVGDMLATECRNTLVHATSRLVALVGVQNLMVVETPDAEHWMVVNGTAEITCGDKKLLLTENQSTCIPLGELHRLANPGTIPLEIIEVQSGNYLGEDDIVRFEDHYGRSQS